MALIVGHRSYAQANILVSGLNPQSDRFEKVPCPAKSLKRLVSILLSTMASTGDDNDKNTAGPSLSENDERL